MAVIPIAPNDKADPTKVIVFSWDKGTATQVYYQLKYRLRDAAVWIDTGRKTSNQASHTIAADILQKNMQYEWKVRIWTTAVPEAQSAWSTTATFVAKIPAQKIIKIQKNAEQVGLRVVAPGNSAQGDSVRVKTGEPNQVGVFDLVQSGHPAESGVRVQTKTGICGVAKDLPDFYGDHLNHTNTGYIAYLNHNKTGCSNHTQTGCSNHTNTGSTSVHSDSGCTNHTNTGTNNHTDSTRYNNYMQSGSPHVDGSVHSDSGCTNHTNTGTNNHTDSYYNNHTNTGTNNHTNTGTNNHVNTGYQAYTDHKDIN
jgi:hypothetical protein